MILHEAIEKLLSQVGRHMTTTEIAKELNKNGWYHKKDGSMIQPYQIHGRTRNYPQIFIRNGSTVFLREQTSLNKSTHIEIEELKIKHIDIKKSDTSLEEELMNEENFKSAMIIDNLMPSNSGIYCIRIKDITTLPTPFDKIIKERHHNIIYIGIAIQSLNKRFLKQELRAKGHGTFFRSLGAILGYRPPCGSLKNKVNKKNYKFSLEDQDKIIE
ncbi:hypothetical protein HNR33_003642 [Brassicibacter mesophilus]